MSNYLRNNHDATRETISPLRRRRLWLATGVVGLTGAVSLAGVAYATTGVTGAHRLADVKWSTAPHNSGDDSRDRGKGAEDEHGKGRGHEGRDGGEWDAGKDEYGKVREVPCDDDALVDALDLTNRDHGGTLKLAEKCTYELGVKDRKSGAALPEIKQDITIKGNGATIKRDAEDAFRIFRVVDGGALTLKDLTVKGGNASEFKYASDSNGKSSGTAPSTGTAQPAPAAATATKTTATKTTAAAVTPVADGGTNGDDEHKNQAEGDGGALLVERGGSAHLWNVKLIDNNAEGNGGAVANFGRVLLEESVVVNNHAQGDGGGVFNRGVLKVEETRVDDNTAGGNGGGIANGNGTTAGHDPKTATTQKGYDPKKDKHDDAGTVEITGSGHHKDGGKSSLSNNRAGHNGGGLFSSGGYVTVSFTAITGNTACENGGGIYAENTDLELHKVHIARNHADVDGGGIVNTGGKHPGHFTKEEATATISDSSIVDNTANRFGGGIFNGEWLVKIEDGFPTREHDKDDNATLTIRDTEIKGNTALNGGGIFNNKAKITLTKTHITKNTATDTGKLHRVAGGILNNEGRVELDDKTLISNNDPTNCANTVEDCFN
jgi:predicted outer membrane repeat protein